MPEFGVGEQPIYRVATDWTDEESAHALLNRIAEEADVDRDKLSLIERRLPIDAEAGP